MDATPLIDPTARIHPTADLEPGVRIGPRTAVWDHVHIRHGARIGRDCIVGEKTYIAYDVVLGDLCKLNAAVYVCAGVTVADGCMFGAHTVFTNDRFPRAADPDLTALLDSAPGPETLETHVERGVTTGANVTIGPGLRIGAFAMIGMGSVVTRDVPPHGLMAGNPARLIGLVDRDGSPVWRAGPDHRLPADGTVIECPAGGRLTVEGGVPRWQA